MTAYDIPKLLTLLDIKGERKGREYEACCPFHEDRNPSWSIQAETGLHFCFACSEGGNPIKLAAHVLGLSTSTAWDWLHKNGLVDNSIATPTDVSIRVGGGCAISPRYKGFPAGFYVPVFSRASSLSYVMARGMTEPQATRWGVVYAIEGPLAGRIVFPIHANNGRLCGFMARTTTGARPRYMTPEPETDPDRTAIFGERFWPLSYIDTAQVVVTEGAINALACERAGAKHIAALGGSNPGATVYAKLAKFGHVLVATDPDRAGERCAMALQVLARWTKVTRVNLPAGLDAADLSAKELQERLMAAGLVV